MVYVWLGLIVAFIAVEAATVNLVSIWFIGGAVAVPAGEKDSRISDLE